ncbi:MAG TPA: choline/ethanolamine kinase family protein [Patescibacteria group bacterium]|nr:choline/ethanolamine kinase family protein [Patescibacteria group bacterium]
MKNYQAILKNLNCFKPGELRIKKLAGGMTNENFLVKDSAGCYVARFAPDNLKVLGLSRQREIYNYRQAAKSGLGAKVLWHYPKHRLLIVEYFPGRIFKVKDAQNPASIRKLSRLLFKLHHGPRFSGNFNPFARTRRYLKLAEQSGAWLPKNLDYYFAILKQIQARVGFSRPCPCHLDLMLENILETPSGQIKLLDWEYSSNADYRYDLAMLMVKGKLNEAQEKLLIKTYFGKYRPGVHNEVKIMKSAVYLAEASYGLVQQAVSSKPVNYKAYALVNLADCRRNNQLVGLNSKTGKSH